MDQLLKTMQFSNPDQPLNVFEKDEYDIALSYGKVTCLVLYLYSMQIGDPPLYAEINKACRNLDTKYLDSLGPFIRVLEKVMLWSERNRIDTPQTGELVRT